MEGIRQGLEMCHTRDRYYGDTADMSRIVSDKRTPPIFVQDQRLKHEYGKNIVGFS